MRMPFISPARLFSKTVVCFFTCLFMWWIMNSMFETIATLSDHLKYGKSSRNGNREKELLTPYPPGFTTLDFGVEPYELKTGEAGKRKHSGHRRRSKKDLSQTKSAVNESLEEKLKTSLAAHVAAQRMDRGRHPAISPVEQGL